MNKSDLEYFHSIGLIDDVDKVRKDYVKSLFLDLFVYLDELDPDGDFLELRMALNSFIHHFFDSKPSPPVIEGHTDSKKKR